MNTSQAIQTAIEQLSDYTGQDHTARIAARAWAILAGRNESVALSYIAAAVMYEPLDEFVGDLIQQLHD